MKYALRETCVDAVLVRPRSLAYYDHYSKETLLLDFLQPFKDRFTITHEGDSSKYTLDGKNIPNQVYLVVIKGNLSIMSKKDFRKLFVRMTEW